MTRLQHGIRSESIRLFNLVDFPRSRSVRANSLVFKSSDRQYREE